jgi:hypothetical protein
MPTELAPYAATAEQKQQFWRSFILAAQAEPREALEIKGASGLTHSVVAIGVDDIRRRIIMISSEPHPKAAALAQADIQAANSSYQVILARPVTINFARFAAALAVFLGSDTLHTDDFSRLHQAASDQDPTLTSIFSQIPGVLTGRDWAAVDWTAEWQEGIQQLSHLSVDFSNPTPADPRNAQINVFLKGLLNFEPTQADRLLGNCAVPLYEFSAADAEVLHRGTNIEAVRDVLRRLHLLQYFFPPPDQLMLGVAEDGVKRTTLSRTITQSPKVGHPLGEFEVLDNSTRVEDVIDSLIERKLLVEGEIGYELSDSGHTIRAAVRFKPREGLLAKLSRLLSLKIDIDPTKFL